MKENNLSSGNRIKEIDFVRGIAILCVIGFHIPNLLNAAGGLPVELPAFLEFVAHEGGIVFVMLSGLSATLGSRSVRRGVLVFFCGMLYSLFTYILYFLGLQDEGILIQWGVLHLIGLSMILYPVLKKIPTPGLAALGLAVILVGYYWRDIRVSQHGLFILGLRYVGFTALDYFPVFPDFGWFMEGVVLGRILYKKREPLFPLLQKEQPVIDAVCLAGRNSLQIYMIQFPVIYIFVKIITRG